MRSKHRIKVSADGTTSSRHACTCARLPSNANVTPSATIASAHSWSPGSAVRKPSVQQAETSTWPTNPTNRKRGVFWGIAKPVPEACTEWTSHLSSWGPAAGSIRRRKQRAPGAVRATQDRPGDRKSGQPRLVHPDRSQPLGAREGRSEPIRFLVHDRDKRGRHEVRMTSTPSALKTSSKGAAKRLALITSSGCLRPT